MTFYVKWKILNFYEVLGYYEKTVSYICSSVQDFSHGIKGLAESTTYQFTTMQTLVILGCTKGFSPAFMWWYEWQETPMLVVDSDWVFTIGILLVIFVFNLQTLKGIVCKNVEGYCIHDLGFNWQSHYGLEDVKKYF